MQAKVRLCRSMRCTTLSSAVGTLHFKEGKCISAKWQEKYEASMLHSPQ